MILYKSIALKFGHRLANEQARDMAGADGQLVLAEEVRQHWQGVLNDLSLAQIYLLDHNAANYLDSLRLDVQGMPWQDQPESDIQNYVREVDFPRDLVWVEYDDRNLCEFRIARGIMIRSKDDPNDKGQRGLLFDNRSAEKLTVKFYYAVTDTVFIDAPFVLEISKARDNRPDFNNVKWHTSKAAIAELMSSGLIRSEVAAREYFDELKGLIAYEMVIGFMLFAALASREDDLQSQEVPSLSTAQAKAAKKFGRTWVTETLRSHLTVRIGPAGERHLTENKARRQFEEAQAESRATPTEHWVAEHERRYSNGKVVRVRSHKRGQHKDRSIPVRVVGPRPVT